MTFLKKCLVSVLVFDLCSYDKHHDPQQLRGGKCIWLTFPGQSPSLKESGQEFTWKLKQRPWWNSDSWITPRLSVSFLPYTAQVYLPRHGTTHMGWTLLHQLVIKKMPHLIDMLTGQSGESNSSVETPSEHSEL